MKPKKSLRKIQNYLIAKDIQLRIAITNFFYLCLISLVIILAVLSPYYYDIFNNEELWVQYLSAKTFLVLLNRLVIALPLIFLISFIHFIVLSHRFCGPMVNIKKSIQEVSRGNFTRKIFLRKTDFFKDEAATVNHMIDQLSGGIEDIREHNAALLTILEKAAGADKQEAELKTLMNQAKEIAILTRDTLGKIEIDPDKINAN